MPERRVAAMAATPASPPTAPTAADPESADAEAHEAALEMFIRLTESDRQPHDTTEVDQGAVRAALARTAARKKPGGERLQPHEGAPGEVARRPAPVVASHRSFQLARKKPTPATIATTAQT